MAQQEEELRGKTKLVFEASLKIINGRKLVEEGTFELNNLLGGHSLKKKPKNDGGLTAGQKSALTKKKLISQPESEFRQDLRTDDNIMKKMLKLVKQNKQVSTVLLKKRLHLSDRRLNKLLGLLVGQGKLIDESDGSDGARHKWVLTSNKTKPVKQKAINGHKLAKTPGGGSGKKERKTAPGRGAPIDVEDEKIVAKTKEFLATNDWVSKGKLLEGINMSPGPGNRLIDHLKKQRVIKEVHKSNNPAHDVQGARKLLPRKLPYFELA